MFEYLLMKGGDSDWHRRYAQLINALYATGYTRRYSNTPSPLLRNIPGEPAVLQKSRIVDADFMSRMIEAHEHMAVLNVCQCRQSHAFEGHSCARAEVSDGCLVFGLFAESAVQQGAGRPVDKAGMHGIVRDRWKKNLVFMTANIEPSGSNAICTCCDCCCHFIESINSFNGRVSMAEPHFIARVQEDACIGCGRCVKVCNTKAHAISSRKHVFYPERCIGCGLCVDACPDGIISLEENPEYQRPSGSWLALGMRTLPLGILSSIRAMLRGWQP
jgi:ferredoxin